jgi:hypothetical protein
MPDAIALTFDTKEMDEALAAMPQKLAGAAVREALQAGGDVLLAALVEHTPERTGEETPDSTALPPGILKEDMHTEVLVNEKYAPRVRVGPTDIGGRVAYWQNDGFDLVKGGYRKTVYNRKGELIALRGPGKLVKHIEGKHFFEAAFDESAEQAVEAMLSTLSKTLDLTKDGGA